MGRVLVVDDETSVRQALAEIIEDLGHEVEQARDGREGLALAAARKPDLIVTDHVMPLLSGVDLCREARKDPALKDVPILLLSGVLTRGIPEAQAFLPKPFELTDLERTLDEIFRQKPAAPSPVAEVDVFAALQEGLEQLRMPLTAARKNLQLFGAQEPADRIGYLTAAQESLARIDAVLSNLLDQVWTQNGAPELSLSRGSLPEFMRERVAAWSRQFLGMKFHATMPDVPLELAFDQARLQQALDVIVAHAVAPLESGAEVAVALTPMQETAVLRVGAVQSPTTKSQWRLPLPRGGRDLAFASHVVRLHGGTLTEPTAQVPAFVLTLPVRG